MEFQRLSQQPGAAWCPFRAGGVEPAIKKDGPGPFTAIQLGCSWPNWTGKHIALDRSSREALGDQVAAAIEARIATGVLSAGDRLPASRELAAALRVNRGTIQAAYARLSDRGLVAGRVGSGTTVVGSPTDQARFDPIALLSRRATALASDPGLSPALPVVADFSRLTPDERFFPLEEFTRR